MPRAIVCKRDHLLSSLRKVIAAGIIVSLGAAAPAHADKRVALVIGNSNYRYVSGLDNPANDARLMAETLRGLGFTLVGGSAQIDLDKAALDAAVRRFGSDLQGADVGLFYYAGHGVQVRGSNYLVPINANPTREADVDFELADVAMLLRQMEASGTRLNLVVLDACRNDPFGGRGLRDAAAGLAQMRAPEGTLISFATQPGNVAQDGRDGNSPFTKAFAQTIRKPGLGIFDAVNEVGLAVKRATGGQQQPWFSTSPIDGGFYFAGPAQQLTQPPTSVAVDPCIAAAEHWRSAQAINTRAAYEDHLKRFPNCAFAGLAQARIQTLASVAVGAPTAAPAAASSQTAALQAVRPLSDDAGIVREFYLALGRGDGSKAASLIVPEKRSSKAYNADEMTKFYASLADPLSLISVTSLGDNKYQAAYTFRTRTTTCNGSAVVAITKRGGQSYIEGIKALNGC
jgi:hypothetical protein